MLKLVREQCHRVGQPHLAVVGAQLGGVLVHQQRRVVGGLHGREGQHPVPVLQLLADVVEGVAHPAVLQHLRKVSRSMVTNPDQLG
jgi:hypothetical protein